MSGSWGIGRAGGWVRLLLGAFVACGFFLSASAGGAAARGGLPPFPSSWHGHLPGVSPQGASRGATAGAVSQCANSNQEVEQAVGGQYVYEAWIGCSDQYGGSGIGFARSTNGGRTFGPSMLVPGSTPFGFFGQSWDPSVAVGPDGAVYVAYMVYTIEQDVSGNFVFAMTPAVAASFDHGQTFPQVSVLPVPAIDDNGYGNWGDRPFIAVGQDGAVYVTWDYGPKADEVGIVCPPAGSCAYSQGDFNAVVQKSTDGGLTWTMPNPITPGFPLGGAYSAPIVVEPNGSLGVLYWGHQIDPSTLAVGTGTEYFTSSSDGGTTWSAPVAVDPGAGTIGLLTWWIDGSLAVDPAGNLYATWDTQTDTGADTGWLARSSDGGQTWSAPAQVTSGTTENLVEVAAAGPGSIYVGWQTPIPSKGYATFLRRFSTSTGWTSPAKQVSASYGDPNIWAGDTFGLSTVAGPPSPVGPSAVASWGSAINGNPISEIYSSVVTLPPHP